jgi:AraC-like DNA-binding protein
MIWEWECHNLASPFWRLYHNSIGDASVIYNGVTTTLNPEQILIIPPNTPFSTKLKGLTGKSFTDRHIRRKINNMDEVEEFRNNKASDHLFIHFNLGLPYDLLEPGIYNFEVREKEKNLLDEIKKYCTKNERLFDFTVCTAINGLILCLLNEIPLNKWSSFKLDKRVTDAFFYIERHIGERLTNKNLADKANMAENSFSRLFKEQVGISIQQHIKKKRIDKSLILMHHTDTSIENIANECGFSDRHHFSRVFKELFGVSPVFYKKNKVL